MSKNYFRELELGLDASADDVRGAYKKLAKKWHPDKNKEQGAEDKFKSVLEAYNYLQSDDRRECHAREIKRQAEVKSNKTSTTSSSPHPPSTPRPQQSKSSASHPQPCGSRRKDSAQSKNFQQSKTDSNFKERPKSSRLPRHRSAFMADMDSFFSSFMFGTFADPFDDILFDIFMVPPERPPPKAKMRTDPFGNKLPENFDENPYDWKSATKNPGKQPDYQEYLDHDTEFSCHYCGLMMNMEMLRKHEPRCKRLGGKKKVPQYQFDDEEVNESFMGGRRSTEGRTSNKTASTKPTTKQNIRCQWCGSSLPRQLAAEHIASCKPDARGERPTPKHRQSKPRPEWNNNFTETERPDDPPDDVIFGRRTKSARQRPSRISVDDFSALFGNGSRNKNCWRCHLDYGTDLPIQCPHVHVHAM